MQDDLQAEQGSEHVRWVKPKNLHITLKFLGEIPLVELEALIPAAHELAQSFEGLTLQLDGFKKLGARRSSVYCLQIAPNDALMELAEALETRCLELGFPPRSRKIYTPHLTLARLKKSNSLLLSSAKRSAREQRDIATMSFQVEQFELMKSQLSPSGASYSLIEEFPLKT